MTAERTPAAGPPATPAMRVFTVPPGRPFLDALARAVLAGDLPAPGGKPPSPIELSNYTLLLPSRRALRAVQEAFLAAAGGRAMLLPRIRTLDEGDEDLSLISGLAGLTPLGIAVGDIPPAIGELERRLQLTKLVLQWARALGQREGGETAPSAAGARTPAQALALAGELARLMDLVETENVSLDQLATLVHPSFSEHWEQTLQFLEIVTQYWPAYLADHGMISAAARRNRLLLAEARRLATTPPGGPLIVAGTTGSMPATTELMRVIAQLPLGAIVLPALDHSLDDDSWDAIRPAAVAANPGPAVGPDAGPHPEHPQFGLKTLLDALGLTRADVAELPGVAVADPLQRRRRLVSEALRPARTTHRWADFAAAIDAPGRVALAAALDGVTSLEAPTAPDEAEAIALILRECVETPGRTGALVTPDRLLARRVATRLEAWGIDVDDSAGRPLGKTVPGVFLDLIVTALAADFAPEPTMALLKHPLARLGLLPAEVRRAARVLELGAFRTIYLGRGLDGLDAALETAIREAGTGERRHTAVRRLGLADWTTARELVARMKTATEPLAALFETREPMPLNRLVTAHARVAEAMSRPADGDASATLWQGDAGAAAARVLGALLDPALPGFDLAARDYPDTWRALIADETVLERHVSHPRLAIWGPYESRLQQPDVVVLGGLNDGTWPAAANPGPWLNRSMRAALGLPAPEAAIGRAAHDFESLLGAKRVYLTRAAKVDGVPTVPSRWLMRFDALLAGCSLGAALTDRSPWLAWAGARDRIPEHARRRLRAPAPCPPVALRPRTLPVTAIERWIANPYAIFAERILRLAPLEPLGREPDAQLRGALIHAALHGFAAQWPRELPADSAAAFLAAVAKVIGAHAGHPRVAAFWLPRMERFAQWFADTEPARRAGVTQIASEVQGALTLAAGGLPFILKARADRIDVTPGGLVITDYKTGVAPAAAQVISGVSPQLSLEAAIALADGFAGIKSAPIAALTYIRVTGGEPPGEVRQIKVDDVGVLAAAALAALDRLIAAFDDPAMPYRALRREQFDAQYRFDAYAHLARVAEWSGEAGEDGDADGGGS